MNSGRAGRVQFLTNRLRFCCVARSNKAPDGDALDGEANR